MTIPRLFVLALAALLAQPAGYRAEIDAFHQTREHDITNPTGWVALVGLHWLKPGAQTVGRDPSNAVILSSASAPARLGTITVSAAGAVFAIDPGVQARMHGAIVKSATLTPNAASSGGLTIGSLTMVLIQRGERSALRVWDAESPARKAFTGLKWMPVDPTWRIDAAWVPHEPALHAKILNVLGETITMTNPGAARFSVGGQTIQLEAFLESPDAKELFFIVRDGTSGKTTYDAGRYLYTPLPRGGRVVMDFNRLENPPCAFTPYATCPLPPASNRLTLAIPAGELRDGHK